MENKVGFLETASIKACQGHMQISIILIARSIFVLWDTCLDLIVPIERLLFFGSEFNYLVIYECIWA